MPEWRDMDMHHDENNEWEAAEKQEYVALFGKLASLSLVVNLYTDYCVFFNYSGHVNGVDLHITPTKNDYNNRIARSEFHAKWPELGRDVYGDDRLSDMKERVAIMERILSDAKIPTDMMSEVENITITHEF